MASWRPAQRGSGRPSEGVKAGPRSGRAEGLESRPPGQGTGAGDRGRRSLGQRRPDHSGRPATPEQEGSGRPSAGAGQEGPASCPSEGTSLRQEAAGPGLPPSTPTQEQGPAAPRGRLRPPTARGPGDGREHQGSSHRATRPKEAGTWQALERGRTEAQRGPAAVEVTQLLGTGQSQTAAHAPGQRTPRGLTDARSPSQRAEGSHGPESLTNVTCQCPGDTADPAAASRPTAGPAPAPGSEVSGLGTADPVHREPPQHLLHRFPGEHPAPRTRAVSL